jgi:hypothetical protein
MGREQLSLASLVDDSPLGSGQIMIIVVCALVAVVDGFDTQSIGLVAPAIAADWHVEASRFGMVFGAGLFGSLIGALVLGTCADRFGRRPRELLRDVAARNWGGLGNRYWTHRLHRRPGVRWRADCRRNGRGAPVHFGGSHVCRLGNSHRGTRAACRRH